MLARVLLTLCLIQSALSCKSTRLGDDFELKGVGKVPSLYSENQALTDIVMTGPWKQIFETREDRSKSWPIEMSYKGTTAKVEMQLKGSGRRSMCHYPTMKFDSPTKEPFFDWGVKEMNVYTHCDRVFIDGKNDPDFKLPTPSEFSWREQVVYQLSEAMGLATFKTRLFEVVYIDSESGSNLPSKGFFMEKPKQLAKRLGAVLEDDDLPKEKRDQFDKWLEDRATTSDLKIDLKELLTASLIEVMIANGDWAFWIGFTGGGIHTPRAFTNTKYALLPDGTRHPIIHDFDLSIFTFGPPRIPVEIGEGEIIDFPEESENYFFMSQYSPMKKLLMGEEISAELKNDILDNFVKKKNDLFSVIDGAQINSSEKKYMVKQLETFYRIITEKRAKLLEKF